MSALAIAKDDLDRHGIGGNNPPLDEVLVVETEAMLSRAKDLAAGVGRATVIDEETAGKATLLAGLIKKHLTLVEDTREERKRPFLESGRIVDAHFGNIALVLAEMDSKKKLIGGPLAVLMGKLDAYRREQDRKAEAERLRLQEEANKQRALAVAAENARLAAEAAAKRAQDEADRKVREAEEAARQAGNAAAAAEARRQREAAEALRAAEDAASRERNLQAEIDQEKAATAAAELDHQAAHTVAAPISSGYGPKAFGRKVWKAEITDLTAALKHCRKVDEATLLAAAQQIYDRQVRAGVRTLPGATVAETSTTQIR